MTPTKEQYAAATAAVLRDLQEEIKAYVPAMFQSRIPADGIASLSAKLAKAALDAAFAPPQAKTP